MWYFFRQLLFKYRKKGVKYVFIKYFFHKITITCALCFFTWILINIWIHLLQHEELPVVFLVSKFYQQIPWVVFFLIWAYIYFAFISLFLNHFIVVRLTCKKLCTHPWNHHQLQYTKLNCISFFSIYFS